MNSYTDRFLEAMKVVSSKKQVEASFDKTIRAQISSIPSEEQKYYTIQYNDLQYKVYTWYEEYVVGDVVYVRIIGGKMDGDKIIEGKVAPILQDRNSTSMVEIPMSKKWVLSKGANMNYNEQSIYTDNAPNEEVLNNSLEQNCLRITAEFQPLQSPDVVGEQLDFINDYYGLKIILSNNREYEFTCKDFMGNPYQADKTYQTYDIYFSEPIKDPGIQIKSVKAIKAGDFYTNCTVDVINLTAQFITVKSYSDEDWVMTYSTDTGYIQKSEEDKIILKSRLFYKGREMFQKDLENNQSVIIEHLTPQFKWEKVAETQPGIDRDFTNKNFNEYYIRYKFIETVNQVETVLASSKIVKIENRTLSKLDETIYISQINKYATETTGLYTGSDFEYTSEEGEIQAWGYGSLNNYNTYMAVKGNPIKEIENEEEKIVGYEPYTDIKLSHSKISPLITPLPNASVFIYLKKDANYYLIFKSFVPPTAEEQTNHLSSSIHLFSKSVIVKYDANGVLGSANKTYTLDPNVSFFPANHENIEKVKWSYSVENLYVQRQGEEANKTEGISINGTYVWTWTKKENVETKDLEWETPNSFDFLIDSEGVEKDSIITPTEAKGNLFARFTPGINGKLNFTAVNKYNEFSARANLLQFTIVYNDGVEIDYPFEVSFLADGNLGTNGTKYALIIEDFWGDESRPYIGPVARDAGSHTNWNGLYLRAQLFDTEANQIIPESGVAWKWECNFLDRLYRYYNGTAGLESLSTALKDKEFKTAFENRFINSTFDCNSIFTSPNEEIYDLAGEVTINNGKLEEVINVDPTVSVSYITLTATYNDINVTSTYPLPLVYPFSSQEQNQIVLDNSKIDISALPSNLYYSSDHSSVIGNSSSSVKVYTKETEWVLGKDKAAADKIFFEACGKYANYCTYEIYYICKSKDSKEYIAKRIPTSNDRDIIIGRQLEIKYKTIAADLSYLLENDYDYFGIYITYLNDDNTYDKLGKTIAVSCNRYFNAMINGWDGNTIEVKQNENDTPTILTPQIISGVKDQDNGFSGAMIGKVTKDNVSRYGIFGYGKGLETFSIDSSTGNAHFEGDITAKTLTLLPKVAGAAGLESGIAQGRKKSIVTRQFKNYKDENNLLVTTNIILGYLAGSPDVFNSLEPIQNKSENKDSVKYSGKPQSSYLIELPGTKNKTPYGFQFALETAVKTDGSKIITERIQASASKKLLFSFIAKIPPEAEVIFNTNNIGVSETNGQITWLTPRQGTGNFEEYRLFVQCGSAPASESYSDYKYGISEWVDSSSPAFSTTGYFILRDHEYNALDKDKLKDEYPNMTDPTVKGYWVLASAECYEILDDNLLGAEDLVGTFAGWEISQEALRYKNSATATYIHSFIQPERSTATKYGVGNYAKKNNWAMFFGGGPNNVGNFGVDQTGKLYANGANISGAIHATSLTLGDKATIDGYATTDYVDTQIGSIQQPTNTLTYTYDSSTNTYIVKDPSSSGNKNISINANGALVAKNAIISGTVASGSSITGNINAETGKIANWVISKEGVKTGDNTTINNVSHLRSTVTSIVSDMGEATTYQFRFLLREPTTRIFDGTCNAILAMSMHNKSGTFLGNNLRLRADGRIETTGLALINLNPLTYKNTIQGLLEVNEKTITLTRSNDGVKYVGSARVELTDNEGQLIGTWTKNGSPIATTSDSNKKNTIALLGDSYSALFDNLHSVTYKYNDGTSNRLHVGFIAQDVKEALDKANISTQDFAGLVISKQGTEDESWYLRYEEFIALNTWQIQKAKARISELETRVSQLESLLQANFN